MEPLSRCGAIPVMAALGNAFHCQVVDRTIKLEGPLNLTGPIRHLGPAPGLDKRGIDVVFIDLRRTAANQGLQRISKSVEQHKALK